MLLKDKYLFWAGLLVLGLAVFMFLYTDFDKRLYGFFCLSPTSIWVPQVKLFSKTGSFGIILPLSLLFCLWLWFFKSRTDAVWVLFTLLSCRIVFALVKLMIARSRPVVPHSLSHAFTYSFPSGHAVNGLMFILVLYSFFYKKRWILGLLGLWLVAIGWSRLAIGAHWASDILAGWGCAMIWIACMLWIKNTDSFKQRMRYLVK